MKSAFVGLRFDVTRPPARERDAIETPRADASAAGPVPEYCTFNSVRLRQLARILF